MSIYIRQMIASDLQQVLLIENESFKKPWTEKDFLYELNSNPVNVILVAHDNDMILGFIDFMITFTSSSISQIAVKKEFRRQGIAQMLLNRMYSILYKTNEVETITLEVRESNCSAQSMYHKNLFRDVVVKPHYYDDGENAIYMCKELLLCQQF